MVVVMVMMVAVMMMVVMMMVMVMTRMSGHCVGVGHRDRRHGKADRQGCGDNNSLNHSCSSLQSPRLRMLG
jgi:hypothetical protein